MAAISLALAAPAIAESTPFHLPRGTKGDAQGEFTIVYKDAAVKALAPTGTLRAAINFGNPVLAQRGPDGEPRGVSVALARNLAHHLNVPLAIVPFQQAGQVTDALASNSYDICFLARDPIRGQGLSFTNPYVLIEGAYAVPDQSPLQTIESVDADGITVAVTGGSAYDLFLTRALKRATIVRYPSNADAAAAFLSGAQPVLAGVKQPLAALAAANPGHHLIPGRFMSIEQALATPMGRDPAALGILQAFLLEAKSSGFVRTALDESNQPDAEVAP